MLLIYRNDWVLAKRELWVSGVLKTERDQEKIRRRQAHASLRLGGLAKN